MTTVDWSTLVQPKHSLTWSEIVQPMQDLGGILIIALAVLFIGAIALVMWQERQQNH